MGASTSRTDRGPGEAAISANDLTRARADYARKIGLAAGLTSEPLCSALASVPRERFLGPGPWKILRAGGGEYQETPDDDPRHLYDNVLVAIDAGRKLNNGEPASLLRWLARLDLEQGSHFLHVGCGVGYYTAIVAEVVGRSGRVVGMEVDPTLSARARDNLAGYANTEVVAGSGAGSIDGSFDGIFVNAGATEVRAAWIDALRSGGKLLLPLTIAIPSMEAGVGYLVEISRLPAGFGARFVSQVAIFHCTGARTALGAEQLERAYRNGGHDDVRRLRVEQHEPEPGCWLHGDGWCLSTH